MRLNSRSIVFQVYIFPIPRSRKSGVVYGHRSPVDVEVSFRFGLLLGNEVTVNIVCRVDEAVYLYFPPGVEIFDFDGHFSERHPCRI